MTTQEHLHREREGHCLLAGKCLPHIFLIRPEFLACHKSAFLPGLIDSTLATISVKMAPISDVRERVIASRLPGPSSLSLWRISAIGEIYGLFLLYWVRTGMERIYSSPRE
jgi:hypothetical protein